MKYEEALLVADNILADGQPRILLRHRIAEAIVEVAPKGHDEVTCRYCIHSREIAAPTSA